MEIADYLIASYVFPAIKKSSRIPVLQGRNLDFHSDCTYNYMQYKNAKVFEKVVVFLIICLYIW